MNRKNDPGLGQWLTTSIIIALGILIIVKLIEYSNVRAYMPAGMMIANIDVGGYTEAQVREVLTNRYLEAPIIIYHNDTRIEVNPREAAEFELDFENMLSDAAFQREQQDFWSGFWGYLVGLPIELDEVELRATHNRAVLEDTLRRIALDLDEPAQPPQPVPATLSFLYGEVGRETRIRPSLASIETALYHPTRRNATLIVEPVEAPRPNINLLANLIVNHLEGFGGSSSIFILDLQTGDEINVSGDAAISGMSLMKVPIVLEFYRLLDGDPTADQEALIRATLLESGNESANTLLALISGQENAFIGGDMVTDSLQKLGLANSYIVTPYDFQPRPRLRFIETPANQRPNNLMSPTADMQTTAEDMGSLLAMLYYCAQQGGGALIAAYEGDITVGECQAIVRIMSENSTGFLIEEGVPTDTAVAHKHGWVSDTHGDAGIVFSDNGDYIIVQILHQPNWLEWEVSSPLMADVSRATYNYFNFESPYLGSQVSNR